MHIFLLNQLNLVYKSMIGNTRLKCTIKESHILFDTLGTYQRFSHIRCNAKLLVTKC